MFPSNEKPQHHITIKHTSAEEEEEDLQASTAHFEVCFCSAVIR